ncbi:MAG: FemAB family PEP-CTERM system-associated protein [Desulfobacteraceae bacterium]|nr:FemAB family PEP-CTERM system-associated protein [Desulfobacteraceae bacterium]
MNIRLYTHSDREIWDSYVTDHPEGTFFHLSQWKILVESSFGHESFYLMAEDHHRLRGVFPLFSVKSLLFGRSMVSLPFAAYGGILADTEDAKAALYRKAVELTQEHHLDYLELRNETQPMPDLPEKDLYVVFKKEISADNDKNFNAIPKKARRMIRLGIKNELKGVFGREELLNDFYGLFAFNYHRLGTPVFSKSYLKNILKTFGHKCDLLVIYKDQQPLSGVLTFYYKDQVIPYYSGAYPEAQDWSANDYLYWILMSNAAERGCRIFDYGRSKKDTGPYHFKRHWGFEPKPLHYQYYLNRLSEMPNISPANPKYRRKIEMWKKLPIWFVNMIGPQIVKYVP